MYLEEIVLDGFKSYANRTVISDFDPQFNAITGLNGSGKSNILDAICFVLGITNLSQVRVRSLQELVYKQGQAGVTKASVTLVFNNRDSSSSPVGYEQYETISITRQVVIGGRNKYLINGHTAQVSQVQNLFHSVQLNVNNPHFLIMQGRITKVLNMKPPEILGMVEEAAGTRMFEDKKEGAKTVIAKKQSKVDEINKLLSEEITPTLDTLRKQRTAYMQWTNNSTEIERLSRFKVAYEYCSNRDVVEKGEETIQELKDQKEEMTETIDTLTVEQNQLKVKIAEMNKTKNTEMEQVLQSLQNDENQKSKELVKKNGELQNEENTYKHEENNYKDLAEHEKELTDNINEITKNMDACYNELKASEEGYTKSKGLLEEFENAVISIENGTMTTDLDGNINDRIAECNRLITSSAGLVAQNKQKLSMSQELLTSLQSKLRVCQEDAHKYTKEKDMITSKIQKYEESLHGLQFDNQRYEEVQRLMTEKENELQSISDEIDSLDAPISAYLKFEYTTPTNKNFHKEGVKGIVANLIHVKDDRYITALETVAGGKLYQVIVDTEETGKYILNEGRLRRRYTFIPLNRIKSRPIPPHKISLAQKIGGSDVNTAISFIASDEELQPALQYVFGNAFICKDLETAKKVTFNEGVNVRSVTLDGDSFDPSGTLEGGSREREVTTLSMLHRINQLREKHEKIQNEYNVLKKEYESLSFKKKQFTEYSSKLEIEKHNMELLMNNIKTSEYSSLSDEIQKREEEIREYEQAIEEHSQKEVEARQRITELKKKQKEYTVSKESHLKEMNMKIESTKKEMKKQEKAVNALKMKHQEYQIEKNQIQTELSSISSKMKASKSLMDEISSNIEKMTTEVSYLKECYQNAQKAVEGKKTELEVLDIQIKQLLKEEDQNGKKINELESAIKKIDGRIEKYEKDKQNSTKYLSKLLKDHPWIEQEQQFFGNVNTDYDFTNKNPKDVIDRLALLQSEQEKLGRHINKKVMTMLEKAEGEYQDLLKKKRIIEKDKAQIQHVIEELENKKNEALQRTYMKVNHDFGEIFASLLPGASARLEPPEGQSVTEGLEVRVAFSGKDKESLSELSGGQRSLLALSLVLALLLFKPAPMYILDEVDAALDLSHTQNIGRMLRKHFGQSQFIIVSLKEGMFNNANVIFRTKFVDGVSTVTRTIGHPSGTATENEENSKRRH